MSENSNNNWKHAVAGCVAGLSTVLVLQPLDVVKTRLQVQDGIRGTLPAYKGTRHALKTILREEGWRALYAGLSPALLGAGLSWGIYFAAYNSAKKRWQRWQQTSQLPPHLHLLSATEAGCIVCCITNPVWVIKTRLQLQRRGLPAAAGVARHLARPARKWAGNAGALHSAPYRGFADAVKQILKEEGVGGFYRGLLPSLLLVSHGAIQFTVYEEMKRLVARISLPPPRGQERIGRGPSERGQPPENNGGLSLSPATISLMGAASKLCASLVTYPSQVVRARVQQRQYAKRPVRYTSGWLTLRTILRREGVGGLYKGLLPNMLRVMPQSALTFVVYEKVLDVLDSHVFSSLEPPRWASFLHHDD
eukprot:jgi/Botrbrau1/19070/Bobra.0785s0001.1